MATNSIPPDIYPFATQNGEAIPFDVLRPAGVISKAFNTSTPAELTWDGDKFKIASFYATQLCLVSFADNVLAHSNDTLFDQAVIVPAGVFVMSALPTDTLTVVGIGNSGTLFVQFVGKWAGLALNRQYQRR